MTPAEFRRAVDRGLGRAALCLMERDPAPYVPELVAACLTDGGFHIMELDRAPYLADLAALAHAEAAVVDAVIAALPTTEDERYDLALRLNVLAEFTKRGDAKARNALFERAREEEGAAAKVAGLGADGLQWLVENRPERFTPEAWEDDTWFWTLLAEQTSGREPVMEILPEVLREVWRQWEEDRPTPPKLPVVTDVEELIRLFMEGPNRRAAMVFGREASDEDLLRWAERMREEAAPDVLWAMGAAFQTRPWPLDVRPLFSRIDTDDRGSRAWRRVLAKSPDPQMRPFALERLLMDPPDEDAIEFLAGVFQPGDEAAVLDALLRIDPEDESRCHDIGTDLRSLVEAHDPLRFVPHLEWAIENNPCSFCRTGAFELLLKADALSEAYRREAAYDAEPDTRALVNP